jgi:hypothetical protein
LGSNYHNYINDYINHDNVYNEYDQHDLGNEFDFFKYNYYDLDNYSNIYYDYDHSTPKWLLNSSGC